MQLTQPACTQLTQRLSSRLRTVMAKPGLPRYACNWFSERSGLVCKVSCKRALCEVCRCSLGVPPGRGGGAKRSCVKVVGIGASAGGLDAFKTFFAALPADTGLAYVVVLHLPPNRRSLLAEILQRWTAMPVREVQDGDEVRPNILYVPPSHASTTFRSGRLHVSDPPEGAPREFRPIDGFFDTLASGLRGDAVGIVLSGTGSDGALGVKAIRAFGGLTIAQSFEDNESGSVQHFDDMPAGAIATGAVDLVCAVQDMPGHLVRLLGRKLESPPQEEGEEAVEAMRLHICALLRAKVGHDFANYKEKTFLRRVHRRMQVRDVPTLSQYADLLEEDHHEAQMLFRDLLIRVTSFFRDGDAFAMIERLVVPRLFADRHADHTVRVWVPGCSTGEEAYSLAILIREHMDTLRGPPRVQIFATDIDEPAISTARLGRYPSVLLDGLSPERRERFFRQSDSGYVVAKEIRDICTFSAHSLVRDPPFSRMDLVSCRNLLIYLDADLQARVVPSFHYSLAQDGILILGISESTARHDDLFTPLDKPARIFLRRNVRSPPIRLAQSDMRRLAHPERSAQPMEQAGGNAAPHAPGSAPGLPAKPSYLRLAVDRVEATLYGLLRRSLRPGPGTGHPIGHDAVSSELRATREELQSITEEHETAVEELRSANEELHSVNEELQSSNEELETSKEEIQSVNEELHTVNAQLQEKVEELDHVNNDLRNLFDSTQIATVFLDRHLVVRGFTPAIAAIYNLIPSDTGRALTDIVSRLRYDTLRQDCAQVLASLAPVERQVTSTDGDAHFIMRVLPYRGSDSVVDGTLVTFLDVTSVVRAEQHQRLLVDELNHRVKNMLTVVVSLASQTLRRADDLETFGEAFLGRVHALSGSYALLSRENWMSVSLRDVVDEEMRPFGGRDMARVVLEGGDVALTPSAALALGMAVHELATNAVKYGALSEPEGQLRVSWRLTAGDGAPDGAPLKWLVLDWVESGGPGVEPPSRSGFGTLLIQRGLSHELGGAATLDFQPGGLRARLCALLERVVSPQTGVVSE